jgi:hypothetical protein
LIGDHVLLRLIACVQGSLDERLRRDPTREQACLTLVLALLILERALGRAQIRHALPIRRFERLDLQPCICDPRPRIFHGDAEGALIEAYQCCSAAHGLVIVHVNRNHPS